MINNIESTISHRVSEVIAAQIACRLQCLPDMKINNTSGENKNSTALASVGIVHMLHLWFMNANAYNLCSNMHCIILSNYI